MNESLHHPLAAQIRSFMDRCARSDPHVPIPAPLATAFNDLALALYDWQWHHNPVLAALHPQKPSPQTWRDIPPLPCTAFRQLDVSCLPPHERCASFVSSGTTARDRSRHWHGAASLALYDHSLWTAFRRQTEGALTGVTLVLLTPPPKRAPHSSLVHMLEVVRSRSGCAGWFAGDLDPETQDWLLPLDRLRGDIQDLIDKGQPLALLGTAFHFVHLTDHLASAPIRLPPGSWIMETGGYKGRSRSLPRAALLQRIERVLDVPPDRVLGEYGMCELGSQAYDLPLGADPTLPNERVYRFPPWAQTLILSPEDDQPVEEDGAGLLHVVDLANAWSAVSIRTGDLVRRRGEGFELLGRASPADPRGCSLNLAPPSLLS